MNGKQSGRTGTDKQIHFSTREWHERFLQQARWTEQARDFFFSHFTQKNHRVLEVGCGTGAVMHSVCQKRPGVNLWGMDLSFEKIQFATKLLPHAIFSNADGYHLPLADNSFDACFCHFLLLWINNPVELLQEMSRVTHPGGMIGALAEPDYGGCIDFPDCMQEIRAIQIRSLQHQGANPYIGRQLGRLFRQSGLIDVHVSLLGGQWSTPCSDSDFELEWKTIRSDTFGLLSEQKLQDIYNHDRLACKAGEKIQFVPTFFAWGTVL